MTCVRILTAAALAAALALSACGKKEEAAAPAAVNDPTIPAECNAYLNRVAACSAKLAKGNPAAAEQMRQTAEQTRTTWRAIPNQTALAAACKEVDTGFAAQEAAMGC